MGEPNYVIDLCEECGGSGDSWDWYCSECGGSGVVCGGCGRRLAECECQGDDDDENDSGQQVPREAENAR